MTTEPVKPAMEAPLVAADFDRDRRLELLLDEMVASSPTLPADFAARISGARPFAPWEVRRGWAWKTPLLSAGGLLGASLAVFLAPLGHLAIGTAVTVWGQLLLAALSSPVSAVLSAGPVLTAAAEALRSTVPLSAALGVLGAGAAFGVGTVAALRRRPVRVRR
jgi:hypothetical protein